MCRIFCFLKPCENTVSDCSWTRNKNIWWIDYWKKPESWQLRHLIIWFSSKLPLICVKYFNDFCLLRPKIRSLSASVIFTHVHCKIFQTACVSIIYAKKSSGLSVFTNNDCLLFRWMAAANLSACEWKIRPGKKEQSVLCVRGTRKDAVHAHVTGLAFLKCQLMCSCIHIQPCHGTPNKWQAHVGNILKMPKF